MRKTLKEMTKNMDMVIFNQCTNIDPEIYCNIEAWNLYDEDREPKEVFQYFVISRFDWEYLANKTGMPLFYSEKMDLHIIGIDFLDHWDNASYEI